MAHAKQLVVCIDNKGYAASLEKRKIYITLRDTEAEKHGLLRIVDESGEDYLYPVAAPTVLAESGTDFLLPPQPDHQTKRLLYRLLLRRVAASLLGFGHQSIFDFDSGAHRRTVL
jgi:hypothetical protein